MVFFLRLLVDGIFLGFLYALSALGFVMIFRSSRVLNFAHGELLALGAFIFLSLSSWANLPLVLAFALTLAGSFMLGFIIERFFFRPLGGESLIQVIVLTLGIAYMLRGLLPILSGGDVQDYPRFLPKGLSLEWGNVQVPSVYVVAFIIGIIFLILFGLFFKYSSQGIYMRALADNRPAALSLGVNVRRLFALSWAIAALVAAMSGIMLGVIKGINIHGLSSIGLTVFPVVILGGLDSIGGAILGGLIIGLLETFTGGYLSTSLGEVIPYVVLVLILILRPNGLLGRIERV